MKLRDITDHLESIAPLSYQESYDNAGLITGNKEMDVKGALLCLDSTEEVIDEAIKLKCNLVIAHHPIVFSGLKKFNGNTYVERVIIKAIQNNIAIYAAHTNLDNVTGGVNTKIAEKLGLKNVKILAPKKGLLKKLVTFCPADKAPKVREALFAAGAGMIGNYDECSFNTLGRGTFRPGEGSNPYVGKKGKRQEENELRIEVIFPGHIEKKLIAALIKAHPYDEVAHDIIALDNGHIRVGSGMIGELAKEQEALKFLEFLKKTMKTGAIRHTRVLPKKVKKIAVCGGSGSFLLKDAIAAGADVFVTSDYKYHQFFDADGKLIIADIGHYESEAFTKELFYDILKGNFPTFALHLSKINTNPVNYL